MPTDRHFALISPIVLTLGAVVAISPPAWSQIRGNNYINGVQGDVVVGRFLINPDPATEGRTLSTSHQIRLGANSQATLNCSNGGIYPLRGAGTYRVSDYCPDERSDRPGPRNSTRAPFDPALPYVISPRNTALIATEALTLEWHPVEGTTSYTVEIDGPEVDWSIQVSEPKAVYSDLESLQPDYRYTVVITAENGQSPVMGPPVGFAMLSEIERDRVNEQVEAVKAKQLDPNVEAIALALVYLGFEHSDRDRQSYALNQAALDVLEAQIEAGTENSQIYLLQADTYLTIRLPLLAKERYEQALRLAEEVGQRELQAESYWGLAAIAEGQTEYGDAIAHLQSAQQLYNELGDRDQDEAFQDRIEAMEAEIPRSSSLQ